ncbi:hypothetical protein CROQUDRAFT_136543 [Cronartium quercuum f. sp. fusiforme G11]|uniref:Armadillo repeat-containing protein 8 n=1 Tax=Cronartium quercuum f. sp. fusiforme G11 TaxID=708437 RepID=A0A9P6N818_9BASI|nr:hypothetical protein CROQUDRAFT_136543 [Cronartium quercuum f. sp. fusiforme G11]
MVMLPETAIPTASESAPNKNSWAQIKDHFDHLSLGGDGEGQARIDSTRADAVLQLLGTIKHSLVGSRVRKLTTMNDPEIVSVIPVLAVILELPCEEQSGVLKLKIEAAAVIGLLCLPEDQTVLGLLRARLPCALIRALTNLLRQTSVETMIFHPTPMTQIQHHLLRTLLRTLASLYSIIQDVSSPRKWGYMTKSPERVHRPQSRTVARVDIPSTLSSSPPDEVDRFNLKGKSKAKEDIGDEIFIEPLTPQSVGDTGGLSRHLGLISKRDELKEKCEQAKVLLLQYLAQKDIIPTIVSISPSSFKTADIVAPCFQLIWLLCKDSKRQVWLVHKLMEARDPITNHESRLKALIQCMKGWLSSNHDQAIESSIRAIGALLSINEPPHSPEDHDLLKALDQMIWGKSNADSREGTIDLNSWGIGWALLTCRAKDGNPALRASLATSSVCLVKNFPDIRLRILKLQIHNAIALIDNTTHSDMVRAEAAYALAHAVTVSDILQLQATEAGVIPVLKKLLDKASEQPFPYSTPAISAQNAMLREVCLNLSAGIYVIWSAYLALASLMSTLDQPRQELIDLNLLPSIVKSLEDESILVRASACQCCRALSRAISIMRTKLADHGAGSRLFDLAFGEEENGRNDESVEEDEDAVEIQLKIVAMGALCNLVLDFSPMKQEVLNRNGIDKFVKLLKSTKHQSLRVSALWGLKNMTFSASTELKLKVVGSLGWDDIYQLLQDKNPSIQENMISLLRNVACGDVADVDIVVRHLNAENQLMTLLENRLTTLLTNTNTISSSLSESIILQTIYTISNIVTGSEAHKSFILGRPQTMTNVYELLSHGNPDIKVGAIWCVINLTHWDETTDSKIVTRAINQLDSLGVLSKLTELTQDPKSDVRDRAECAMNQIMKRR